MESFLDANELRSFLNATRGSVADLAEVEACGAAACEQVESLCGPILTATVVERVEASNGAFTTRFPVNSLMAAERMNGDVVDVTAWRIVEPRFVANVGAYGALRVTYSTGWVDAPRWAITAAKIIARHMWRTQIGPMARDEAQQGSGFLIPNQALALLEPHMTPAGLG